MALETPALATFCPLGAVQQPEAVDPFDGCDGCPCFWHDVQETLRQEWSKFSQTLEDRMQEHFCRQELLMNQQALRLEMLMSSKLPQREFSRHHTMGSRASEPPKRGLSALSVDELRVDMTSSQSDVWVRGSLRSNQSDHADDRSQRSFPRTPSRPLTAGALPLSLVERHMNFGSPRINGGSAENLTNSSNVVSSAVADSVRLSVGSVARDGVSPDKKVIDKSSTRSSTRFEPVEPIWRKNLLKACSCIGPCLGAWIDWACDLEQPPLQDTWITGFVESKFFQAVSGGIIVANGVVTVTTTNLEATTLQEDDSLLNKVVNTGFVTYYLLELVLKLVVHKLFFFWNNDMWWNIFDFILVILALYDLIFSEVVVSGSVNVNHMRTMRILRLAKILRVVRVMRFFTELRLILNSLMGSIASLFWSIIMLILIFFIFSMVFVSGATSAMIDGPPITNVQRLSLREHWGSMQAGMVTLYKSTTGGGDWDNFYADIQLTGDMNSCLFLFFIAFAQFALLNILTGIFVENAMKLAQPDRDTLALQKRKQEIAEAEELRRLCRSIDSMNTGYISEVQFMQQLQSDQFKARLAVLGLDIKDAELFFNIISSDYEANQVEIEAFVHGAMRLKGVASSLDLQTLMFGTKLIHSNQIRFHNDLEDRLRQLAASCERLR